MISTSIFFFALALSLLFIYIGSTYREEYLGVYLSIAGFLIMLVVGLVVASSSVSYVAGETVNTLYVYDNDTLLSTSTQVNNEYETYSGLFHWFLSFVLIVSGIAGISSSATYYVEKRNSRFEDDDYED